MGTPIDIPMDGTTAQEALPTILIIDDSAVFRKFLKANLSDQGYRVLTAKDGPTGLAIIDMADVDLVLLDVIMPGMDGFEVCRRIKARHDDVIIPVLMCTSLEEKQSLTQGFDAGADDFIQKPYDKVELLCRIRSFLKIRRQQFQLMESYRRLKQLEDIKERFAQLLMHDLKNPIASIFSNAELIRALVPGMPMIDEVCDQIRAAGNRLMSMIANLMDITRMEEGTLTLNRELRSVGELVDEVVTLFKSESSLKAITIEGTLDEGVAQWSIDYDVLMRVLSNIVSNSLRYTPHKGHIWIRCAIRDGALVFRVEDDGPGIPAEKREAVFEKYTQMEDKEESRYQRGLGLYFCKLAVEAHGGTIRVEEGDQGGARFVLDVPEQSPEVEEES